MKISLKFVPKGPINNMPTLFPIMAWHRPGVKPLSEPMMVSLLTHICVTRPQWVNQIAVDVSHGWIVTSQPFMVMSWFVYVLISVLILGNRIDHDDWHKIMESWSIIFSVWVGDVILRSNDGCDGRDPIGYCWSLGMDKLFHTTLIYGSHYWSVLGL